jgi:hypothetical protein
MAPGRARVKECMGQLAYTKGSRKSLSGLSGLSGLRSPKGATPVENVPITPVLFFLYRYRYELYRSILRPLHR